MIKENSGKFFRFKLDFKLGYGFAEVYDFTDIQSFDGTIVFVFNRLDKEIHTKYAVENIRSSGIALGPIRLYKYPNTRGIGSWKYLFKSDNFIIEEPNITKSAQDLAPWIYDWDGLKCWHASNWDLKQAPDYVPYHEVRCLETRILNASQGIVKKFTMRILIDSRKDVSDFYDLSDIGNINMFTQLVNTYYPLEKTKDLIKLIPVNFKTA